MHEIRDGVPRVNELGVDKIEIFRRIFGRNGCEAVVVCSGKFNAEGQVVSVRPLYLIRQRWNPRTSRPDGMMAE